MGLFGDFWRRRDVAAAVEAVLDSRLRETVSSLNSVGELAEEKLRLTEELAEMRRERATLESDLERERLDVEHKLGLERMRQKQEAELAQTELDALRSRLEAEKQVEVARARLEAKEAAIAEAREQMEEFTQRQERMIEKLLEALPTAKMFGGGMRTVVDASG